MSGALLPSNTWLERCDPLPPPLYRACPPPLQPAAIGQRSAPCPGPRPPVWGGSTCIAVRLGERMSFPGEVGGAAGDLRRALCRGPR